MKEEKVDRQPGESGRFAMNESSALWVVSGSGSGSGSGSSGTSGR